MRAWLWQFLAGYVTIKIEGLKLLQYLSDAAAQGIALRDVERESFSRIYAVVSWRDCRRLVRLARNRPLRVVELRSSGIPGIAAKAGKRLVFVLGLALCVAALAAVNLYVLEVRVTGCTKPGLAERVLQVAEAKGLRPGADKAALDLHGVERALLLEVQEITFAAVRINGVVATVSVVEGVPAPQLVDKNKPCDVTAAMDGVVRKVILYDGAAQVAAGDTVRRGQVLVGSAVTSLSGVRLVHARAEVMASVWYEGSGAAPLLAGSARRTGNAAQRQWLEFAGYRLPVGGQGPDRFSSYDTEQTVGYLLGPGLKGPRLVTQRFYETQPATEERDFNAALGRALEQALDSAAALVPQGAWVLGSRTVYDYAGGNIVVRVFVETLQNIAVETPVG